MPLTPEDFGSSFKTSLTRCGPDQPQVEAPFFVRTLREHLVSSPRHCRSSPRGFRPTSIRTSTWLLQEYMARDGRSADVLGVAGGRGFSMSKTLSDLVSFREGHEQAPSEGPVEYVNIHLDGDPILACVARGLHLVRDPSRLWPSSSVRTTISPRPISSSSK